METENDGGGSENNRKDLFITLSISSFLIKEFYLFPNYTIPSDATVSLNDSWLYLIGHPVGRHLPSTQQ